MLSRGTTSIPWPVPFGAPRFVLTLVGLALLAAGCRDGGPDSWRRPGANVLLITLDTTRADYVGAYGSGTVETPHLDALAAEGTLFTNAATSVPMTRPAHTSLMTGRWPTSHGVRDNGGFFVSDDERTLAEELRSAGYETGAVVAAFVLHHSAGLDQGFGFYEDRFEDRPEGAEGVMHVQRDGAEVVDRASAWLEDRGEEPFFLWVHFFDPHYPYEPKGEFARRYPDDPYAAEVAYTDAQVGRLLDLMRERGILDSTLVVIIGDHGEALGEHQEFDHGIFLYEPTMRVPLIVRAPNQPGGRVVEELARDVDVMPTILEITGLSVPPEVEGSSLLPLLAGEEEPEPRHAFGESWYSRLHYGWSELHSARDRRYKYIQAPEPELYDLVEDPAELNNVVDLRPGIAAGLRERLIAHLASAAGGRGATAPSALDPETAERLRSLGYVGSLAPTGTGPLPDPKTRARSLELFARVGYRSSRALREGRPEEAVALVEEALAVEPNYLDGYLLLGEAQRKLGRLEAAATAVETGLALSPDDVNLLHQLARIRIDEQRYGPALALLERIREISPKLPSTYHSMREVYAATGRHADALAVMRALLEIRPDDARAHYEAGLLLIQAGDFDAAEAEIREALRARPRLPDAHFNLALIAERAGDAGLAEREYRAELELFPAHYQAWANLGILLVQTGRPAGAEEAFRKLVEIGPERPVGYYLLARLELDSGRADEETLRLALRAAELEPSARNRELVRRVRARVN